MATTSPNIQINISKNGTTTLATAGKYCETNVDVNINVPVPSGYIKPSGSKTITENGTHDVTQYASAVVNVAGKPTQFTNYYDPANVTIDTKVYVSSNVAVKEANSEVNIVRIPYHHKANEPFALRMRGIGTVRSNFVVVGYKADGATRANHWYLSEDNYWSKAYDEHGDMVLTAKGSALSTEWYFLETNFQYVGMNSATTALTGPIITINEPIGNGGYVG